MDLLITIAIGTIGVNWHIQSDVSLVVVCRRVLSRIQATAVTLKEWRLARANARNNE